MPAPAAAAEWLAGARTWTSLPDGLQRLRSLASPYIGVVSDVTELLHNVDDVRSYYIGTQATDSVEVLGHPCNSMNGGGAFDRDEALAAAIGETVERYAAAYRHPERIVHGSAAELDGPCIDPALCALFSDEQYAAPDFPYVPFTATTPTSWIDGIDLRTGRPALLPAQVVTLNAERAAGEPRICYGTSNGLSCHASVAEATLGGLLEQVERDAVMIAWHARLSLPRIDLAADPDLAAIVARHFAPSGLETIAVDLTSITGIPTALGIALNEHSPVAALGLGAASAPTLREAVVKALLEAFQTRTWSKSLQHQTPPVPTGADWDTAIRDFDGHVRLYADPEHLPGAAFLWASEQLVDPREAPVLRGTTPGELIAAVLDTPELAGCDVYATDLTTVDVADAGLRVIRVYSPQLQPLDVGFRTRFLGGPRLRTRPAELGHRDGPLTPADLNPVPHPFP